jgi:hypothetical protein
MAEHITKSRFKNGGILAWKAWKFRQFFLYFLAELSTRVGGTYARSWRNRLKKINRLITFPFLYKKQPLRRAYPRPPSAFHMRWRRRGWVSLLARSTRPVDYFFHIHHYDIIILKQVFQPTHPGTRLPIAQSNRFAASKTRRYFWGTKFHQFHVWPCDRPPPSNAGDNSPKSLPNNKNRQESYFAAKALLPLRYGLLPLRYGLLPLRYATATFGVRPCYL